MFALGAQGESIQSICSTNGVKPVLAAGQKLVHVNLMAHIPHKFVVRSRKYPMQREGQFNHTKVRSEMSPVNRQFCNQLLSNLPTQLGQLRQREFFYVRRLIYHVQESAHIYNILFNRKFSRPIKCREITI